MKTLTLQNKCSDQLPQQSVYFFIFWPIFKRIILLYAGASQWAYIFFSVRTCDLWMEFA